MQSAEQDRMSYQIEDESKDADFIKFGDDEMTPESQSLNQKQSGKQKSRIMFTLQLALEK